MQLMLKPVEESNGLFVMLPLNSLRMSC